MPKSWYDRSANRIYENDNNNIVAAKEFNLSIVADKKPYFMIYIYPSLMKDYKQYVKNAKMKCIREFRITLDELLSIDDELLPEAQKLFKMYYYSRMPVGIGDCVMNKICTKIESVFDGCLKELNKEIPFKYEFLKSNKEYSILHFNQIKDIYEEHNQALQDFKAREHGYNKQSEDETIQKRIVRLADFKRKCFEVCSDEEELTNIVLDLCYRKKGTKQFAWDVCANRIIHNLLEKNDYTLSYPVQNDNGNIYYCGIPFKMNTQRMEG